MLAVLRLGGERTCAVFPRDGRVKLLCQLGNRESGTLTHEEGDDAEDGMGLYEKGGAIGTWCGQLALYDLQSDELTVDCLACIANRGRTT